MQFVAAPTGLFVRVQDDEVAGGTKPFPVVGFLVSDNLDPDIEPLRMQPVVADNCGGVSAYAPDTEIFATFLLEDNT